MHSNPKRGGEFGEVTGKSRKLWVKPTVSEIVAGSAEAVSRDGNPDGGPIGQSRS